VTERDIFGQAGEILAAWHRAEPPRDTPDVTAWLAARSEQWLELADMILPAEQLDDIRAHVRALAELGPLSAVPCHLDFTPRNLLCDTQRRIGVIDFEHTRYDLAARDLVRLSNRVWRDRPDLKDAFLAGYGTLSDLDRQVIEHCTYLDTLTAAVRATGRTLSVGAPT
jgi:Ser/Thr protein kinase RdoA (MazF antagonist)